MAVLINNLTHIAAQAPKQASKALLQTAQDIYEISQQLVPVDTSSLKKSGGVEVVDSHTVRVGYGSDGVFFEGREPSIYATYVEYGTSLSAAQPYLTPAFIQAEATYAKRLKDEMEKLK